MMWLRFLALSVIFSVKIASGTKLEVNPFELVDQYVQNFENRLGDVRSYLTKRSIAENKEKEKDHDNHDNDKAHHEDHHDDDHHHHDVKDIGTYDFIVIGAGSSGSVIASRLSEVPEWKILLLEAGYVENVATMVPSMHACLKSSSSPMTWGYYSTPQNHSCLDMDEHRCYIPTARAVGGTTAINDMIYTRGDQRDYDLWADTGLKGWCWESLSPYFKKIEDAHLESKMDKKSHSYGGPVHLESPRYPSKVAGSLLKGGKEIGLEEIDINGKNSLGLGYPQLTTKDGQRFSAASAYLTPALQRKNLVIKPLSQATKILISEHTKESRGVEFLHEGHLYKASADKEIILSGGAINSAKLLLLSGIGPKKDLKSLKIEPLVDLKVGEHLFDHTAFPGLKYYCNLTEDTKSPYYYASYNNKVVDYLRNRKGPLTSTGVDLLGFIKTAYSKGRHEYPDVELLITENKYEEKTSSPIEVRYDHEESQEHGENGFTVNLVLLHPKSRGNLKLKDSNPLHQPLIDLNALSDEHNDDIETLLSAIHTVQKLVDSHPVQKQHHAYLDENVAPKCSEHYKFDSDDYWRCAIKHLSYSMGHVTGTAPMGIEKEKEENHLDSVVDLNLRVHGVEKLRVADDSVVPVSISGHLEALKMVIGEKCAELMKEEWLK